MKIIKAIAKAIDRIIIIPITRLVLAVTSFFGSSSKRFENWLTKKSTLLFLTLAAAISLFIVIDQRILSFTTSSAEVLKDQSVNVIYNEEAYVVTGLPETVDVTLIGSKTDLYIAKQSSSHEILVDLSGLKPGTHKVDIEYSQSANSIEYMVNPSVATIIIYPKVSEIRTLDIDILNQDSLDEKLMISNVSYSEDKVVIKGTEEQLNKVANVKALVDANNIVDQTVGVKNLKDVSLKAYDVEGEVVDVEIVPETIDVEVTVTSPSKELPVKIVPVGEVAFGKAISSLTSNVTKITVYGINEELTDLNYIPIEIDVTDLEDSKEFKVEIVKPAGVRSMSVNNATVNVSLSQISNRDLENVSIEYRNLSDGYSVQGLDASATSTTVSLKGVEDVINAITQDEVSAYIDLEGLEPGDHEVDVKVEGSDSKVTYTSKTLKVNIRIVSN